jgi:hypothetical protein
MRYDSDDYLSHEPLEVEASECHLALNEHALRRIEEIRKPTRASVNESLEESRKETLKNINGRFMTDIKRQMGRPEKRLPLYNDTWGNTLWMHSVKLRKPSLYLKLQKQLNRDREHEKEREHRRKERRKKEAEEKEIKKVETVEVISVGRQTMHWEWQLDAIQRKGGRNVND